MGKITIASPDMLSTFFMLLFLYAVICKYSLLYQSSILLNLLLIRPDNMVLILTYLATVFLYLMSKKKLNWAPVFIAVVFIAVYYSLITFYHYPGWKNVFYDTFIFRRGYITEKPAEFSFEDYLTIVVQCLIKF